jgi:hypothetical protein
MIKKLLFILTFISGFSYSQTYTQPTVGINSTYAGACMVNTCSGTFYDNGGAGGNYAANINAIYRTFCPSTAGMCVRATFTSFSMNDTYFLCGGPSSCCDYLQVLNGPVQNSPALYSNCTSSPGTITSTNSSGCLTFRHITDGSVQLAGWAATLSCVPCAGGPVAGANTDCSNAIQVCNDNTISTSSPGPGLSSDGCTGCVAAGGEVYSSWYVFQASASGTIGLTIDPTNNADDYDFAIYGPGVTCGALGTPIRCSYAAGSGNTGMGNLAVDNSEDVSGNSWVSTMPVTVGQTYYLMISNWSPVASGFLMDWQLTAGASLNCTPLSVELEDFSCKQDERNLLVKWTTHSEHNSDYFILEKSVDGINYFPMVQTKAQGNTSLPTDYFIVDNTPSIGSNYYRLTEVDLNGDRHNFGVTVGDFNLNGLMIRTSRIYTMSGQIIAEVNGEDIDLKSTFSNADFPDAVYILETVDYNGHIERIKFVQIKN